jgi:hypothetical protein
MANKMFFNKTAVFGVLLKILEHALEDGWVIGMERYRPHRTTQVGVRIVILAPDQETLALALKRRERSHPDSDYSI